MSSDDRITDGRPRRSQNTTQYLTYLSRAMSVPSAEAASTRREVSSRSAARTRCLSSTVHGNVTRLPGGPFAMVRSLSASAIISGVTASAGPSPMSWLMSVAATPSGGKPRTGCSWRRGATTGGCRRGPIGANPGWMGWLDRADWSAAPTIRGKVPVPGEGENVEGGKRSGQSQHETRHQHVHYR